MTSFRCIRIFLIVLVCLGDIARDSSHVTAETAHASGDAVQETDIPHIQVNSWQLLGPVNGTRELFHPLTPGTDVAFDVVLPKRGDADQDHASLEEYLKSSAFQEHLHNIKDTQVQSKVLILLLELGRRESTLSRKSPVEVHLAPVISIRQGSISFLNETGHVTFFPERRVLSKPQPNLPERELKFRHEEFDIRFFAEETRFVLALSNISLASGEPLPAREYYGISFPVRKEGDRSLARIRMKISEDFEGELGYWEYISYAYLL